MSILFCLTNVSVNFIENVIMYIICMYVYYDNNLCRDYIITYIMN